jgi:hypothetical protein
MSSSRKGFDEVVTLRQVEPTFRTWAMESVIVKHVEPWKPEMATTYGSQKEMALQKRAASLMEDPYYCLFGSFKVIFGEQLSLFL